MLKNKIVQLIILFLFILAAFGFIKFYSIYGKVYKPNIFTAEGKRTYLYIPTGSDFNEVMNIIDSCLIVKNKESLMWVIEKKNYKNKVKPGRYRIKNRTSNNEFVNLLRAGRQEPVKVTFNNIRLPKELAQKISQQLEVSENELNILFNDKNLIDSLGFNIYTFPCIFIPNTYEFFWNTSGREFVIRMNDEYKKFWNSERQEKAKEIGLTPEEVATLASIVDQEAGKNDEKPKIAGLYINRLNKGMRLQADPTVKYALGNFAIKRVWKKHLTIDSPYNTYKYGGLPPGPICFPSIQGINAVLNYQKHKYLYFCAKEDFSGYHNFATNINDHNRNRAKYIKALNSRRIYK